MSEALHTITIALPADLSEDQVGRFAEAFADSFAADTVYSTSLIREDDPFHGPWRIQWLINHAPETGDLNSRLGLLATMHGVAQAAPVVEPLPDINWLEQSYRQFPAFSIGRFFIHGSHTTDPCPSGMMDVQIDAATAFGSGDHGTTSGCLLLMQDLKDDGFIPTHVLDMGCGSGILSVGACRLWPAPVLAVDIEPESVRVTINHRDANSIGDQLTALTGNGFAVADGPYDLIIANILPQPLKDMAIDLNTHLAPGGYVILSGMLTPQVEGVMPHYTDQGFTILKHLIRGEWSAVLLQKRPA